ncbi:hypothetical protein JG688_00012895 [Phytophthora aleatoria]|uniref:Uncharacterized protein n=1 Tax=Phytophthora aleatoria TaxID=2496075 RepID=A0A8J5ME73_9STRA|nr:hypothetical protein JG688_00012895 [Phytophthora aleatoria]
MWLLRNCTYLSSEAITFFSAAYAGCTTDGTLFSLFLLGFMVFFVREGRNVTLKKKNMDAHAGRCSNCWDASCVDCSVGDKNESKNGMKETPQERWMDVVQSATCPEDRSLQDVLTRIVGCDNVPRKKNKFLNFVTNSLRPESNEATPVEETASKKWQSATETEETVAVITSTDKVVSYWYRNSTLANKE